MAATDQNTESVDLDSLGASISETVEQAVGRGQRITLTRHGAPFATIVSEEEIATLDRLLWDAAFDEFKHISDAFRDVPLDELEREIERAVTEVREEMREERGSRQGS
jgi:antitoxin (DNA-binding transcriptional repressor) of toxin-antitoxin stability system